MLCANPAMGSMRSMTGSNAKQGNVKQGNVKQGSFRKSHSDRFMGHRNSLEISSLEISSLEISSLEIVVRAPPKEKAKEKVKGQAKEKAKEKPKEQKPKEKSNENKSLPQPQPQPPRQTTRRGSCVLKLSNRDEKKNTVDKQGAHPGSTLVTQRRSTVAQFIFRHDDQHLEKGGTLRARQRRSTVGQLLFRHDGKERKGIGDIGSIGGIGDIIGGRGGGAHVNFRDVTVREYEVMASDNPAVSAGVAIELGWKYNVHNPVPLDQFESVRSPQRSKNFLREKKLLRHERERILREFGATQKDIQKAAKRATIVRLKRRESVRNRQRDKFHERMEERMDKVKEIRRKIICYIFRTGRNKGKGLGGYEEKLHPSLFVVGGKEDVLPSRNTSVTLDSSVGWRKSSVTLDSSVGSRKSSVTSKSSVEESN